MNYNNRFKLLSFWKRLWFKKSIKRKSGVKKGYYLEAHHIKSYIEYPQLNGKICCFDCHKREHK
jgi:hypothetical protein